MLPFPDISPEIFSININGVQFALRWYAVSYILGFVAAIFIMKFFVRRSSLWRHRTAPFELDQIDNLITYLIIGVILGGRLGYVFFYNADYYLSHPFDMLRVWDGGMSFHGGFLGVVIAAIFFFRYNGIPMLSGADLIAIASPPGLFFGRIANFINAELWGRPTMLPWGIIFPGPSAQNCPEIPGVCARHPSQLYEAGLEGFLLFIVLLILAYIGALKRPGFITGIFISGYGISRFLVEFVRVPDPQFFSLENPMGFALAWGEVGLTMGQLLSVPMILFGMLLILMGSRRRE